MKNLHTFFYLILLGLGMTACSPRYYTPDTHNIPLISEKGETNAAISLGGSRVEFQASHGLTNGIALKANGGFYFPGNFGDDRRGSGKFIEFGGGYFKQFNESWIFEAYGVFGLGSVENDFPRDRNDIFPSSGFLSSKIRRIGFQPNIGYKAFPKK